MNVRDHYAAVDDILMSWANEHGFKVGTQYRDDFVRSIWFYDRVGNQRAQILPGVPSTLNVVTVFVVEFRPDLPRKCGGTLGAKVSARRSPQRP